MLVEVVKVLAEDSRMLKGFFDLMMFTTRRPPKTARSLRDVQPLPPLKFKILKC